MTRFYAALGTALLCSAALSAQSGMDKDKGMDHDKMAKDGMTMVTGCVAQGADMTHFNLTHAAMSSMPMGKMDSGTGADMATPEMATYALDGGTNLKAHLGHKVEITGTMDKDAMNGHDKMAKSGPMSGDKMGSGDKDKMGSMGSKDMMAGKIKVKAVKMLSESCM